MLAYKASGKAPIQGILVGIVLSIISGLIVGGILHFITHTINFSLIIIFPLVAGAIAGIGVSMAIKSGKIRNGLLAAVFGLIAATTITVFDHYLSYQSFLGEIRQELSNEGRTPSDAEIQLAADLVLQAEVGKTGFAGFYDLEAKSGVSIGRGASKGVSTGGFGYNILAFVEWLLMAGAASILAFGAANQPFDERSNQWYGEARRLVSVPLFYQDEVLESLNNRRYADAGRYGQREAMSEDRIDILIRNTPNKKARDLILEIEAHFTDEKGKATSKKLKTGLVSRASARAIYEAAETANATNANATMMLDPMATALA